MTSWMDATIKVSSEGELEVAPDGDVHCTWIENGHSFTIIVSMDEARRLAGAVDRLSAQHRAREREAARPS